MVSKVKELHLDGRPTIELLRMANKIVTWGGATTFDLHHELRDDLCRFILDSKAETPNSGLKLK